MQIRPTKAVINLRHLADNYRIICSMNKGKDIIAVVKADAYGHGAKRVVEKLITLDSPPVCFAVATVEEVIDLIKYFPDQKFMVFEPFSPELVPALKKYNFAISITSPIQLQQIKEAGFEKNIDIHLKLDTGMGRVGIKYYNISVLINELRVSTGINVKGVYTHFATSDEDDDSFTSLQNERFVNLLDQLREAGISTGIVHAANSGAIFDHPATHYDAVRPGIALYGYYKNRETSLKYGLKPVMSLQSKLSTVERFIAGESISYGRRFILAKDSWVASIPLGYADGVNRALRGKFECGIEGKLYPQVGTITMDRILLNLGDDYYSPGSEVTILSTDNSSGIDAWNWCQILDTIPYEITCNISKRVHRVYGE
ncbi:MAG: alanine racemase [Ignavibacteriales bacterium]|nr:alanine racemase [Ignavibacteriales bacterium]